LAQSHELDLWQKMSKVTHDAKISGHLKTIDSKIEIISCEGVDFVIRFAAQLSTKIPKKAGEPNRSKPFLSPEPELFVQALGEAHNLILNKFNILPIHGLITTKNWVSQTDQLSLSDFAALELAFNEVDGFIFYNGGQQAGASQDHRHFQLVPKDLGAGKLPIESAIERLQGDHSLSIFPFNHRYYALPNWQAETLYDAWQKMEYSWQPYNLLITRDWMIVVPRSCESLGSISINSLGYAGALLAKSETELEFIRRQGPMAVLNQVSLNG
jgi:ATP adenylyltransferase